MYQKSVTFVTFDFLDPDRDTSSPPLEERSKKPYTACISEVLDRLTPQRTNLPCKFYVAGMLNVICSANVRSYVPPSNMYYVYILQSKKNQSLYIGYTTDIEKRLAEHNSGKSQATKPFRPYELIYYEAFINMKDAKSREEYLKSGWGRRTINKMLKNYFLNNLQSEQD